MFTREQLLDSVWGRDIYIDERTVDVHIGRLRKLLNPGREQDPIRTVRGAGYALDDRSRRRSRAAATSSVVPARAAHPYPESVRSDAVRQQPSNDEGRDYGPACAADDN